MVSGTIVRFWSEQLSVKDLLIQHKFQGRSMTIDDVWVFGSWFVPFEFVFFHVSIFLVPQQQSAWTYLHLLKRFAFQNTRSWPFPILVIGATNARILIQIHLGAVDRWKPRCRKVPGGFPGDEWSWDEDIYVVGSPRPVKFGYWRDDLLYRCFKKKKSRPFCGLCVCVCNKSYLESINFRIGTW